MNSPESADQPIRVISPSGDPDNGSDVTVGAGTTLSTFPVRSISAREAEPVIRRLVDLATDPYAPTLFPLEYAVRAAQLGQVIDLFPDLVLSKSILHNLGKEKAGRLLQFKAQWDEIREETKALFHQK